MNVLESMVSIWALRGMVGIIKRYEWSKRANSQKSKALDSDIGESITDVEERRGVFVWLLDMDDVYV